LDKKTAIERIENFPGLIHRQEIVETIDGVMFVNDSKATNPDATARALASYDNIYWIAGGVLKEGGFDPLMPYLGKVHHAYLIGDGADTIRGAIGSDVPCTMSETIDNATKAAYIQAIEDGERNPVVMLSPACSSFDQFKNFEERGVYFKKSVSALHKNITGSNDTGGLS
jgi:UDP-N-acetylmuramoylalanine--D-glutamate ligase